jgi:hypothetical protein
MPFKTFKVFFARTAIGRDGIALFPRLLVAIQEYGANLPVLDLSGEKYQMRDLQRVGTVLSQSQQIFHIKNSFCKLSRSCQGCG